MPSGWWADDDMDADVEADDLLRLFVFLRSILFISCRVPHEIRIIMSLDAQIQAQARESLRRAA